MYGEIFELISCFFMGIFKRTESILSDSIVKDEFVFYQILSLFFCFLLVFFSQNTSVIIIVQCFTVIIIGLVNTRKYHLIFLILCS